VKQKTKRWLALDDATPADWDSIHQSTTSTVFSSLTQWDAVTKPEHYNSGAVECIDGIESMLTKEEFIGYLRGNSLKYRWRYPYKNGTEDLRKAAWYEERLLKTLEADDDG